MILNRRGTRYALLFVVAQVSLFTTSIYSSGISLSAYPSGISLSARCHAINNWMGANTDVSGNPHLFSDSTGLPLFKAIPGLSSRIPYIGLAQLPTPVAKLGKLGAALGNTNIYMKNDAHAGITMGGNKIRKLPFLLGWALLNKADLVITCGAAGSNHSAAAIDCCSQVGLPCISFLSEQIPTTYTKRNLLLSFAKDGELHLRENFKARQEAVLECAAGHPDNRLFYMSAGGSVARGSLGFVNAAFELADQVKAGQIPEPDFIVVAAGSNGTAAGLSLGLALAGLKSQVFAVCTTPLTPADLEDDTVELHAGMLKLLGIPAPDSLELPIYTDEYFGGTYALATPKTVAALDLMSKTEGINLDVTYAGKALAALCDLAANSIAKDKNILFWNTFCADSLEEITSKIDYHSLPPEFHKYFTADMQAGDLGFS